MTEDGDFPGEDFPQIISKRYNDLTKSEKRIADYIRKNQDECAFLSAGELAARLDLSEATLVRFARTLGFASYPAMREILQRAFRSRVTHSVPVSYTHLRAHETVLDLVCRLLLEKKKQRTPTTIPQLRIHNTINIMLATV